MDDDAVIAKAYTEDRVLITNDKDFGEKVYREGHPHKGIVLLRLDDERALNKIAVMKRLLETCHDQLVDQFVVVKERQIRLSQKVSSLWQ